MDNSNNINAIEYLQGKFGNKTDQEIDKEENEGEHNKIMKNKNNINSNKEEEENK